MSLIPSSLPRSFVGLYDRLQSAVSETTKEVAHSDVFKQTSSAVCEFLDSTTSKLTGQIRPSTPELELSEKKQVDKVSEFLKAISKSNADDLYTLTERFSELPSHFLESLPPEQKPSISDLATWFPHEKFAFITFIQKGCKKLTCEELKALLQRLEGVIEELGIDEKVKNLTMLICFSAQEAELAAQEAEFAAQDARFAAQEANEKSWPSAVTVTKCTKLKKANPAAFQLANSSIQKLTKQINQPVTPSTPNSIPYAVEQPKENKISEKNKEEARLKVLAAYKAKKEAAALEKAIALEKAKQEELLKTAALHKATALKKAEQEHKWEDLLRFGVSEYIEELIQVFPKTQAGPDIARLAANFIVAFLDIQNIALSANRAKYFKKSASPEILQNFETKTLPKGIFDYLFNIDLNEIDFLMYKWEAFLDVYGTDASGREMLKPEADVSELNQCYRARLRELRGHIEQHGFLKELESEALKAVTNFEETAYRFLLPTGQNKECLHQSLQELKTALEKLWESSAAAPCNFYKNKANTPIATQKNIFFENAAWKINEGLYTRLQASLTQNSASNKAVLAKSDSKSLLSSLNQFIYGEIQRILPNPTLGKTERENYNKILLALPQEDSDALHPQIFSSFLLSAFQAIQQVLKASYAILFDTFIAQIKVILTYLKNFNNTAELPCQDIPITPLKINIHIEQRDSGIGEMSPLCKTSPRFISSFAFA